MRSKPAVLVSIAFTVLISTLFGTSSANAATGNGGSTVVGFTVVPSPATPPAIGSGDGLATGFDTIYLLAVGLTLVVMGAGFVLISRGRDQRVSVSA